MNIRSRNADIIRKPEEKKPIVLEGRILSMIVGRASKRESEELFQKPNMLDTFRMRRLQRAGHAWRCQNSLLHTITVKNPEGKIPLGRPDSYGISKFEFRPDVEQ